MRVIWAISKPYPITNNKSSAPHILVGELTVGRTRPAHAFTVYLKIKAAETRPVSAYR
jgi:hypothetical protein